MHPVTDPILLFLITDTVALLLLGTAAAVMPRSVSSFLGSMLCGLGFLLCLPPLLTGGDATGLTIPLGPPGLSLHFALDPLAIVFLITTLLAGTAVTAFQAATESVAPAAPIRVTAHGVAGIVLALLAADGVTLALGLTIACAAMWQPGQAGRMMAPIVVLAAVCLLTPAGYPPRFDAIRAAPIDMDHAAASTVLIMVAVAALAGSWSSQRCWVRDALTPGIVIPFAAYLMLRVTAELAGTVMQGWWGALFLLAGGAAAVVQGWKSASQPDLDAAVAALIRRQSGLAMAAVGLALIARAADLPVSATFALDAAFLTTVATSLAGTVTSLAIHAAGTSAGTYRLSRLGGLIHTMPATSAAISAGLLALSALPPGLGFASLWLSFQSILSAPRTGGLLAQIPLALAAAAIALSAALASAASVRIIGIAILGRPRTPRGAGARESKSPIRTVLLTLTAVTLAAGVFPGAILWLLTDPAVQALNGLTSGHRTSLVMLSLSGSSPAYLVLPVCVLLALATGAAVLAGKRTGKETKPAGPWLDGMPPDVGLPFGEPAAQSTGAGFLPPLPRLPRAKLVPASGGRIIKQITLPKVAQPSPAMGVWMVLTAFAVLLLVVTVTG